MATEKDQYSNLFGSSDEESGDDEAPPPPRQQAPPPPASKPAAASSGSESESGGGGGSSSSDSGSSSSSSDESSEDERPVKKRLSKGGGGGKKKGRLARRAAASSSDESSGDEGKAGNGRAAPAPAAAAAAPAARSRAMGLSALDRAAADFEEPESSDEEGGGGDGARKPFVARSVSSGSSSSSSSGEDSSDDEGDSRRKRLQKGKKAQQRKRKGAGKKAAAAPGLSDGESSDSDRGGARGARGSASSAASSRRPGRELTVVEQALQKLKRNRGQKLPEKEVQERTQHLIDMMEAAAREDKQALAQRRPAMAKLSKLQEVLDLLRSKHLQGALVDNGQLLGLIKAWIQPLPDKTLPMYAVRTPLIEYLVNARVEVHRLKESGIGAVIQKLRKHPDETLENKARLGEIVDNWSRLITGKGTHLKTSMHAEEGGRVVSEMNRGGGGAGGGPGGDGYIYAKTGRGVEIPIRPGFNFKKVALSFKGMDDRGQGKEDEALEVADREPRGDGFESRATKVRKALKDMGRKGSGKRLRAENVSHSNL